MGTTLELKLNKETGVYGPAIEQVLEGSDGELSQFGVGGMVRQVVKLDATEPDRVTQQQHGPCPDCIEVAA